MGCPHLNRSGRAWFQEAGAGRRAWAWGSVGDGSCLRSPFTGFKLCALGLMQV